RDDSPKNQHLCREIGPSPIIPGAGEATRLFCKFFIDWDLRSGDPGFSAPRARWHAGCVNAHHPDGKPITETTPTKKWAIRETQNPLRLHRGDDIESRSGITSKRRSPWLCPAPSWGAGLFRLRVLGRTAGIPLPTTRVVGLRARSGPIGAESF